MRGALSKPWREGTVKILVLLTDEPALGSDQAGSITGALCQSETICFCATYDTPYYRSWANESAGSWVQIGSSMDTEALLAKLRSLVNEVATVAAEVHAIAGGSVRRYFGAGTW